MHKTVRNKRTGVVRFLSVLALAVMLAFSVAAAQEREVAGEPEMPAPVELSRTEIEGGEAVNIVVEFPAVADTFITSGLPNTNWGTAAFMRQGFNVVNGYGAERMLMRFDFSSIPSNALVNSATFRIYLTASNPPNDAPLGFEARHLAEPWDPLLVTWNSHQPNWGGVFTTGEITSSPGWKETNATNLVRQWVSGAHPNHGFIVIANETPVQRDRVFTSINAGGNQFPRVVVDYTISTDTTPPTATVEPLPQWSRDNFTVRWNGQDNPGGSGIHYFDVQYQINGGPWNNWRMGTTSTESTFSGAQNGATYGFRARAVDNAGNVGAWPTNAQAGTTIDTLAPSATVAPLAQCQFSPAFIVSWSGTDNAGGSGIASYDVQYQINNGPWLGWFEQTTQTSAQFTGAVNGDTYGFRVRAWDNAGNVQVWSPVAQAQTTGSTLPPDAEVQQITPPITDQDNVVVSWTGSASPCSTLSHFDVRYRYQQQPWVLWQSQTNNLSAVFDFTGRSDGNYQFEARAVDSLGRVEEWRGVGEAFVILDKNEPFLDQIIYLPQVFAEFSAQPGDE